MTAHRIMIADYFFGTDSEDHSSSLYISSESIGKWTVELQTARVLISSGKFQWSCDMIPSHNMDMVFHRAIKFVKSYLDMEEVLFEQDADKRLPVDEPEPEDGGFWFQNYEGTVKYVVKGRHIFRIDSLTGFTSKHNRLVIERQDFVKTLPEIPPEEEEDSFCSEYIKQEMESVKR